MKTLKIVLLTILMLITGITGIGLFFSEDAETLVMLIMSKPIGGSLIAIAYLLNQRIKELYRHMA